MSQPRFTTLTPETMTVDQKRVADAIGLVAGGIAGAGQAPAARCPGMISGHGNAPGNAVAPAWPHRPESPDRTGQSRATCRDGRP